MMLLRGWILELYTEIIFTRIVITHVYNFAINMFYGATIEASAARITHRKLCDILTIID